MVGLAALSLPPPYEPENHEGAQQSHQEKPKQGPLKTFWRWTTHDPVAFYTSMLALFTGALVAISIIQIRFLIRADKTARLAAEAATLNAKAAVAVALPVIRALPDDIDHVEEPVPEHGGYVSAGLNAIPSTHSVFSGAELRNVGRTQAFPVDAKFGWAAVDQLPNTPSYAKTVRFHPGDIIKETEFRLIADLNITLTDEQIASLNDESSRLWVYCRLTYTDIMQSTHEANFCWYWGTPDGDGNYYLAATADVPVAYIRKT